MPEAVDPRDPRAVNDQARTWAAPGEVVHPVPTDRLVLQEDALAELVEETARLAAGGRAFIVMDATPMDRRGASLKPALLEALRDGVELTERHLPAGVHATLEASEALAPRVARHGVVVAIGSGSITDIAKYARHLAAEATGRLVPFVCFPTAASVTAYTSALAVLQVDGVKRTLPARPPESVIGDVATLAAAPRLMTLAGFGDLLARGVSSGDWLLAHRLGMAERFSHVPARLLEHAEEAVLARADGLAEGTLEAVETLMEAILLAGMAMSLVGETAPLSGWEHVISHYLDMTAEAEGRAPALHGLQVGVATCVAARAYEEAWPVLDADRLTEPLDDEGIESARGEIERWFARYDASGAMAAEIWRDAERKLLRWQGCLEQRRAFVAQAGQVADELARTVRPAAVTREALQRAGVPHRFADLSPAVPREAAERAVRHGHTIRARFTLGDLLAMTGWLDDTRAAELVAANEQTS